MVFQISIPNRGGGSDKIIILTLSSRKGRNLLECRYSFVYPEFQTTLYIYRL